MRPLLYRSASAVALFLSGVAGARDARADEPKLTAAMQCDRASEPGRVRCSVEVRATGNGSIAWADVALIELPDFTTALKGRIGPADAVSREPRLQRWAFGLVAKKNGTGEARGRVRAVVCTPPDAVRVEAGTPPGAVQTAPGTPECEPLTLDVVAKLEVG